MTSPSSQSAPPQRRGLLSLLAPARAGPCFACGGGGERPTNDATTPCFNCRCAPVDGRADLLFSLRAAREGEERAVSGGQALPSATATTPGMSCRYTSRFRRRAEHQQPSPPPPLLPETGARRSAVLCSCVLRTTALLSVCYAPTIILACHGMPTWLKE